MRGAGVVRAGVALLALLAGLLVLAVAPTGPLAKLDATVTRANAYSYDALQHRATERARALSSPQVVHWIRRDSHAVGCAEPLVASAIAVAAEDANTELVQRAMSRPELDATEQTGLVRGGREGTSYVSDNVNSNALRARQRLALAQTPEVRVTLEVPRGAFSPPKLVDPNFDMPGGGMERMGTGQIACRIVAVLDYC